MKKRRILFAVLILTAAMIVGCAKDAADTPTEETSDLPTEDAVVVQTPAVVYAAEDVVGTWCVGSVLDSAGVPLGEADIQRMGAGFSLELLDSGDYFVYDANGVVLGQGTYTVAGNVLMLSAGDDDEIRYVIDDENTLSITSSDDSVTVMTRSCSDIETDVPDEDTPEQADMEEGAA